MTVVAAIDCGTNSVRLLITEAGGSSGLRDLHREMRIVRLGQDVDRTGRLAPDALERTAAALGDYAATIEQLGADRVRLVATSATRDAANRDEFEAMVQRVLGVRPDVVSGVEEAQLSFAGASSVLTDHGPLLVADIGGGSTELVRGGDGDLRAHSMDVGSVRMTERYVRSDPMGRDAEQAIFAEVARALDAAQREVPADDAPLIGVAGTVTPVAALALGLDRYDSVAVHGSELTVVEIEHVVRRLAESTAAEREAMSVIHPGRRDVIAAGAVILLSLVDHLGLSRITVSEHDILDGIALGLVG